MTPALQGHASMLLFSALVAGSFSLGVQAANEIAPSALNAVRFWIAAIIIGCGILATTGFPKGSFKSAWRYFVLGGLFALYFVLMFEGLKTAPPVSAAAVFTLTPIISAFFGWVLLRQVVTHRMALALSLGAVGALWVIFRADFSAFRAFDVGSGELIYFVGCVSHAIYTPMVRKLNRGEAPAVFTFGMLVAGGLILTIVGWQDLRATRWSELPNVVWIALFYLAVFASAASFLLLQTATLRLPAAKVMAYTYFVPSWVICWEVILGNGVPPALILVGVMLTIAALALLLRDEEASTASLTEVEEH